MYYWFECNNKQAVGLKLWTRSSAQPIGDQSPLHIAMKQKNKHRSGTIERSSTHVV